MCLLGLVACGDDGGGAGDGPIATMLDAVPDKNGALDFVIVNDVAAARELAGLETLEDPDTEDVEDELVELTIEPEGVQPAITEFAGGRNVDIQAWRDDLGFDTSQVDRDIAAGSPPEVVTVVDGRFDVDQIDEAVNDDEIWSDELDEDEVDGTTVYSWLDDDERDLEMISATRPLGQSARLAVLADDRLAWASNDDLIEDTVATANGDDDSLADREDLGEIAAAMDGVDTVSALLSASADQGDEGPPGDLVEYPAFGIGATADEDGDPLLILALWHEEEDDAEHNAEALQELADDDEVFGSGEQDGEADAVDVVSIEQDGRVVLGVFEVDDPSLWSRLPVLGDPLVRADLGSNADDPDAGG